MGRAGLGLNWVGCCYSEKESLAFKIDQESQRPPQHHQVRTCSIGPRPTSNTITANKRNNPLLNAV